METKKLYVVNKEAISKYIGSRQKVSNHTMNQRYIGIVGLLKFIDKKSRGDFFANMIWMIKRYPLQKIKHDDVKIGFEIDDEQKIENYLTSPLDGSSAKDIKIRAFILLMIRSGLRASEAIGLKMDAVKLLDDGKTYSLMVLGKGNAIGKSYIKTEDFSNYYEYLVSNSNCDLLIPTNRGTAYNRSNLYRDIKKTLEDIGVNEKGLHIFRHHFASNFATKDGRIGVLQRLLRHSSVRTTMIYSKIREQELSDAISGI
jgi:site-specific recombinase XerD